VCALSGLVPTPFCPKTRSDWFIDGTEPTQPDNVYQPFVIDRATGLLATDQTPADRRVTKVYAVLPQDAQAWAVKHGFPQPPTTFSTNSSSIAQAPTPSNATPSAAGETLRLLSPDPYTIFQLTPLVPLDTQQIRLTAAVLPATPANLGVFQAACVVVLHAGWHVGIPAAVAYGVILQAVEISTAILMGMPALLKEGMSWREIRLRAIHATPVKLPARPGRVTSRHGRGTPTGIAGRSR